MNTCIAATLQAICPVCLGTASLICTQMSWAFGQLSRSSAARAHARTRGHTRTRARAHATRANACSPTAAVPPSLPARLPSEVSEQMSSARSTLPVGRTSISATSLKGCSSKTAGVMELSCPRDRVRQHGARREPSAGGPERLQQTKGGQQTRGGEPRQARRGASYAQAQGGQDPSTVARPRHHTPVARASCGQQTRRHAVQRALARRGLGDRAEERGGYGGT
mmetsp:Transcript_35365/g.110253  ORF Transcript_35365/g.110253 Transcript_35365/m.110253 type:complete len:223 (+) Transcript_35365:155-823(+)